jgi:hypothetical protein
VICAQEIASYGLVPELLKRGCLEATNWGYRRVPGQACVEVIETAGRVPQRTAEPLHCGPELPASRFEGAVYQGDDLNNVNEDFIERGFVRTEPLYVTRPKCDTTPASPER